MPCPIGRGWERGLKKTDDTTRIYIYRTSSRIEPSRR
jgi:hypothetical protein